MFDIHAMTVQGQNRIKSVSSPRTIIL